MCCTKTAGREEGICLNHTNIVFIERTFPSANMVLIKGERPVLIDTGFGSDIEKTKKLITYRGVLPEEVAQIVNTHYHSDHAGGNYYFQQHYQTPIAAHKWEAGAVNAVDPEACSAEWLDQPVEPYCVQRSLSDGDEITAGSTVLQVVETPGHTLGHVSLYVPENEVLIAGDLFHRNDLGWLNSFREGTAAIHRSMESLEKLAGFPIKTAYSGHGPAVENPAEAIDNARKRTEKWLLKPEKVSWHACKRIFAYSLIIKDGLHKEEINSYLLSCGWFRDFARYAFYVEPEDFIPMLMEEMIRSGAALWSGDYLTASAPYNAPEISWMNRNIKPKDWERVGLPPARK
ncbi:MAG: MBL fold metallo-hydrolase [Alkalicoccus sp.]|nr:MAG: MBL fold metallo-hydrolase [Alkalicoccus sp.]